MLDFPLWLSGLRTQLVPMRMHVLSLASFSGLGTRHCLELWCRSQMQLGSHIAVAVVRQAAAAPIQPLARDLTYATSAALKKQNKTKQKKQKGYHLYL